MTPLQFIRVAIALGYILVGAVHAPLFFIFQAANWFIFWKSLDYLCRRFLTKNY